jgi:hypothetical protein
LPFKSAAANAPTFRSFASREIISRHIRERRKSGVPGALNHEFVSAPLVAIVRTEKGYRATDIVPNSKQAAEETIGYMHWFDAARNGAPSNVTVKDRIKNIQNVHVKSPGMK